MEYNEFAEVLEVEAIALENAEDTAPASVEEAAETLDFVAEDVAELTEEVLPFAALEDVLV